MSWVFLIKTILSLFNFIFSKFIRKINSPHHWCLWFAQSSGNLESMKKTQQIKVPSSNTKISNSCHHSVSFLALLLLHFPPI